MLPTVRYKLMVIGAMMLFALAALAGAQSSGGQSSGGQNSGGAQVKTGGWAWTQSHAKIQNPAQLLGGPLKVTVNTHSKDSIGFWVYPGLRKLDPHVFGFPGKPLAYYPAPYPLYGVPVKLRGVNKAGTSYTTATKPSPFNSNWDSTRGSVSMTVVDATATDAAVTQDKIDFKANFKSPDGKHSYTITVNKPLPHGFAYPFFGGVATNVLLHGFTGVGTPQMPTEFTYVAFWGVGTIKRDGQVVNKNQLVHIMVTEPVRGKDYKLLMDKNIPSPIAKPTDKTLHIVVAPFRVTGSQPPLAPAPVKTGVMVKMPNGQKVQQPFFHVMFNKLDITAQHMGSSSSGGQ